MAERKEGGILGLDVGALSVLAVAILGIAMPCGLEYLNEFWMPSNFNERINQEPC